MTPQELDQYLTYLASIGIERVYWQFYEPSFIPSTISTGEWHLDLACRLAHAHGMECYALIKPFETGVAALALPSDDWDCYDPGQAIEGVMGQHFWLTAFVRAHPEMRIQHRDAHEPVNARPAACLKLVKEDDSPTDVTGTDLELYTAEVNSRFRRHEGRCEWREGIEERNGEPVRVLVADGLQIPAEEKYVLVLCNRHSDPPTFVGRSDRMLELYDDTGERTVATWDEREPASRKDMATYAHAARMHCRAVFGQRGIPEDYGRDAASGMYRFDLGHRDFERVLDAPADDPSACHIAVVRGCNPYHIGALHPCYPVVRAYWLSMVERAIAAGVDGVDFRIANHSSWCSNPLEYGFNTPIADEFRQRHGVDILCESFDVGDWKALQTEHYTDFLRCARDRLAQAGRKLQLHVNGAFELVRTQHPGCVGSGNNVPANFHWPWESWIRDGLADAITLKDTRPPMVREAEGVDFGRRVCAAAQQAGIPVYVDSWICDTGGHAYWDECVEFIRSWQEEPGVGGCTLYEGYLMFSWDAEGQCFRESDAVRRLVAGA